MFDAEINHDLKHGTLIVSKEIAPVITGSIGTLDAVTDEGAPIREIQSVPVELESGEKVHVIGRQETLVLTLLEEVNFMNYRIIIKSKIDLEVLCCKTQRKWKIRQILSPSGFGGSDLPATVNITVAEDEED
jgi:hypothetical protein